MRRQRVTADHMRRRRPRTGCSYVNCMSTFARPMTGRGVERHIAVLHNRAVASMVPRIRRRLVRDACCALRVTKDHETTHVVASINGDSEMLPRELSRALIEGRFLSWERSRPTRSSLAACEELLVGRLR